MLDGDGTGNGTGPVHTRGSVSGLRLGMTPMVHRIVVQDAGISLAASSSSLAI